MDLSNLSPNLVSQLAGAVENYILGSRKKYVSKSVPLAPDEKAAMQPFFAADVLDRARLLVLTGSRIQDPAFYSMARMMGIRDLPSFSDVAAVTFVDVVVSHEPFTHDLLFHELVHVVQYGLLGSKQFASLYVNGFVKGGSYEEIPLEKNAYDLESRFSRNKTKTFSVADEVRAWLK
jgi:hypothetical protein